ncbi:MAG: biliverdin-producing heme oxygenase [Herminiimonas sp.]|nr:biliverdin-producing heme oxygenase [Herminiimonas sp.]
MLKALKAATSSRHAALERRFPLLDPNMSIASYRQFIQWLFGFYAPLETQLMSVSSWEAIGLDYRPRQKTPRLRQDLLILGDTDTIIAALPHCDHLPPLMNEAQLWGCLYVIEGATLGGQIIMKHLHSNLGLSANSGASFFDGYGCETGTQWKAFCAAITACGEEATGGRDALLLSANHTFDALSEWLFPGSVAWSGASPETLPYAATSAQREVGAEHAVPSAHR